MQQANSVKESIQSLFQEQTDEKVKTIRRLLPIIVLFNTTLVLIGIYYKAPLGFYILSGCAFLLSGIVFLCIRYNKYLIASIIHIIGPPVMLTMSSILAHNKMGIEYLLYSNYLLPFLFLRNKWSISLYFILVSLCISLIVMDVTIEVYMIEEATAIQLKKPVIFFSFVFFGFLLNALVREFLFTRQLMESSAHVLEAYSKELEKKNDELERISSIKDRFLSIISHDIRNPLTSIQGSILLLQNHQIKKEEQSFLLRKLYAQTTQTTLLLDNIVKWVQAKSAIQQVTITRVVLQDVILDIRKLFDLQMLEKEVRLISAIPEKAILYTDRNIIALILRNFIHNALKFSPGGSEILVEWNETETHFTILVIDQGTGLPSHYTIQDATEQNMDALIKEKGHGIGLALCHYFTSLLGGKIEAFNNSDIGATFSVTLPKIPNLGKNEALVS
ncbi:MAG: HAMP domain-containing histidine kinase [Cytophagaceae bacterium]|jgi:signal transduction histidine kinase|nr:HAMP domain-containing histidine kinase [Cytophagaceae bacterium]